MRYAQEGVGGSEGPFEVSSSTSLFVCLVHESLMAKTSDVLVVDGKDQPQFDTHSAMNNSSKLDNCCLRGEKNDGVK